MKKKPKSADVEPIRQEVLRVLMRYMRVAAELRSRRLRIMAVVLTLLCCYLEIWWINDSGGTTPGWCAHLALFEDAPRVDIRWNMVLLLWIASGKNGRPWQHMFALGSRTRWFCFHLAYLAFTCMAFMLTVFGGTCLFSLLPIRDFDYALGWERIGRILPVRSISPGGLAMALYGANYLRFLWLSLFAWWVDQHTVKIPLGAAAVVCIGMLDRVLGLMDMPISRSGLLMTQNAALMDLPAEIYAADMDIHFAKIFIYWGVMVVSMAMIAYSCALGIEFVGRERYDG